MRLAGRPEGANRWLEPSSRSPGAGPTRWTSCRSRSGPPCRPASRRWRRLWRSGRTPLPRCAERGRTAVHEGVSLGETLSGLRETYRLMKSGEPDFGAAEALAVAWSDSTLQFLHELSCEDPITGLSSQPHLRSRLDDVYRAAQRRGDHVGDSSALVLVELPEIDGRGAQHFERLLWHSRVGEAVRTVYSGDEAIAALGPGWVAALVARHAALGASVSLLRGLLGELRLPCGNPRVWIEGLPSLDRAGRPAPGRARPLTVPPALGGSPLVELGHVRSLCVEPSPGGPRGGVRGRQPPTCPATWARTTTSRRPRTCTRSSNARSTADHARERQLRTLRWGLVPPGRRTRRSGTG